MGSRVIAMPLAERIELAKTKLSATTKAELIAKTLERGQVSYAW
jgi:hypothetical protein